MIDETLDIVTAGEPMVLFAARQPGPLDQVASLARSTAGAELNVAIGLALHPLARQQLATGRMFGPRRLATALRRIVVRSGSDPR